MKVLITCPPMLRQIEAFRPRFAAKGIEIHCPDVVQVLSEAELITLVPQFDGWIIGDDPATKAVFAAGKAGRLRAAVKWGVGVDNVDFSTAQALDIPVVNTPRMFGAEVADMAMGYIIALARHTFAIDRAVRSGDWIKPAGISLAGKTVALVGLGDIGRNTAKRLLAADMKVLAYDPGLPPETLMSGVSLMPWPQQLETADFIVLTCALTPDNYHLFNAETLNQVKSGVRLVNVARGPLIDETALVQGLATGKVHSAALDVFEHEPLPMNSPLRQFEQCIWGTHNASNTLDAVQRASDQAIQALFDFLGVA